MDPTIRHSQLPLHLLYPTILTALQFSYTSVAIASVSFSVTKASVILFFLRLATERSYRIVCYLAITYITMYTSSSLMINLFGCKPISGGWDRRPTNPSVCVTNSGYYYYATTSNAAMDVMLLVLPIPIVLRLRLAWRVKLGLVAMFSMGFLFVPRVLLVVHCANQGVGGSAGPLECRVSRCGNYMSPSTAMISSVRTATRARGDSQSLTPKQGTERSAGCG